MRPSVAAPETTPLIFNWGAPRQRRRALVGFLLLSLIAHASCFYLFQIVYPPTIALLPPPAHVSVISPRSEEGRTLLRWIDAEDPALAFATQRAPETRLRALPKTSHVPSYLRNPPVLKELPPPIVDLRAPSSQPPGLVPVPRESPPELGPTPTTVSFSDELEGFGAANLPPPNFRASRNEPPEAIRFRVAVGPRGDIRYCFALNSSGDSALDDQARRYLAQCRFAARSTIAEQGNAALAWGVATVEWGNDVAMPNAVSNKAGAP